MNLRASTTSPPGRRIGYAAVGSRPIRDLVAILVVALVLGLLAAAPVGSNPPKPARPTSIMFLFANEPTLPANGEIYQGLQQGLQSSGEAMSIYLEYLDVNRFPGVRNKRESAAWYRQRYRDVDLGALVAVGAESLHFLLRHRADLWPRVPVVFCAVMPDQVPDLPAHLAITGVTMDREFGPTARAALDLVPEARRVVFVSGTSGVDLAYRSQALRELKQVCPTVPVVDWTGLSYPEMEQRIASLPASDVLLLGSLFRDGQGRRFVPIEAGRHLLARANRPAFCTATSTLGYGITGGKMFGMQEVGSAAAGLVLRVMRGEPAGAIPVMPGPPSRWTFDDRQLRRFGLPANRLPPGSQVLFHTPSTWERHWGQIVAVALVCLLQTATIAVLLHEIGRRRLAGKACQQAEELKRTVLASFAGRLAVLDQDGRILIVNSRWGNDGNPLATGEVGDVYLEGPPGDEVTAQARAALRAITSGSPPDRPLEYPWSDGGETRWGEFRVRRLERSEGGAVVTCYDITARKRAEAEIQRQLHQASHAGVVAAMGELAGGLAHELNQPLAASLSNAQAARRMLQGPQPDLAEVREALDDLVTENLRAREVVRRVRAALQRREFQVEPVDLKEVAAEVGRLTSTTASLRGVTLSMDLQPAPIAGDKVQLQQVVLNLVLNALEACECSGQSCRVALRTGCRGTQATLEVRDSGGGIPEDRSEQIFQAYFTTKKDGLGLGLSICRTIVEMHGGTITAENDPRGGAVFRLTLPAVEVVG